MTIQDKHKKIASAKWKQYVCLMRLGIAIKLLLTCVYVCGRARGGKAPTSDRETTKPTAAKPPTQQSRPLALANPLPSGKQNSDDDSQDDEDDDSQEGDEAGNGQASTSSPPGQTGRPSPFSWTGTDSLALNFSDDTQDESSSRFGRRKLVSNQDRYEEKTDAPIPGEEGEKPSRPSELAHCSSLMLLSWLSSQMNLTGKPATRLSR